MIDEQSFRRYAATYGGDLSRWPPELLQAVGATLQRHPEWDAVLQAEWSLDEAMHQDGDAITALADLRARILNIPQQVVLRPAWLTPRRLAPTLLLCSLLGLLVGANDPVRDVVQSRLQSAWIFAPEQIVSLY